MSKYGYRLEKAVDSRPDSLGNTYGNLWLTMVVKDGDYYDNLFTIRWLTSESLPRWYGFQIDMDRLRGWNFKAAVQFLSRIEKADMYDADPADFVAWLDGRRDVSQVAYDKRVSHYKTVQFLEDHSECDVWQFWHNGRHKSNIYAVSKNHCFEVVDDKIDDPTESYYRTTLRESKDQWFFQLVPDNYDTPVILTAEEWVENPFAVE